MTLLLSMLPFYLIGNVHCAGMCGPLVFMLARHRFRYFYFLGRTLSFALCGLLAGAGGAVLNIVLEEFYLAAAASLVMGVAMILVGAALFFGTPEFSVHPFSNFMARMNRSLSVLMLQDQAWPTFLFGFFTILLPCGQTLIVFSACAVYGDPWAGFINGLCFALLTSPALAAAMHTSSWMGWLKPHHTTVTASCAIGVGLLSICRGLAEMGLISHLVLNEKYHFVIY